VYAHLIGIGNAFENGSALLWVIGGVFVLGLGVAFYFFFHG